MKSTLRIAFFVVIAAAAFGAVDLQIISDNYDPVLRDAGEKAATAVTARFEQFTAALDKSLAVDTARYVLTFRVSSPSTLLDSLGGFVFSFPEGFDVTRAEVGALVDDHPELSFTIQSTLFRENVITVGVAVADGTGGPVSFDSSVEFSLVVADVINAEAAGEYQLAGLAFSSAGGVLAGPAVSNSFRIYPREMQTLAVTPGADTTVAAGTVLTFAAIGYDVYGNEIVDPAVTWSLAAGSQPIGSISGSTLVARTVGSGQMQATAGLLSAWSGMITVIPGELAHVELNVPSQQLVGWPLFGPATATLRDAYGNLYGDHDLAAEPLVLQVGAGTVNPSMISDNAYINGGVVDLAAAGVLYNGATAQTVIRGQVGSLVSNGEAVSFSGYDVLAVIAEDGGLLTQLPADASTMVRVVVQNNGALTAKPSVWLRANFPANPLAGGVKSFLGGAGGDIDTIALQVLTDDVVPGGTDLLLRTQSKYEIGGQVYEVQGADTLTVVITEPVSIELVSDAIGPDTLYPGAAFPLAFDVRVTGLAGLVDSTRVAVALGGISAQLFSGLATGVTGEGGVISYSGIAAIAPGEPVAATPYGLTYTIYAGAQTHVAQFQANTAVVLEAVTLSYVAGSLRPRVVAGGFHSAFAFDVNLNVPYAVALREMASTFSVQGVNFAASASFQSLDGPLSPGVNPVQTEAVFIPESQIDQHLIPGGRLVVFVPSADAYDTVDIAFGGETVPVRDLGVTQIVALDVVAPNAPNVNTSQPFQLRCLVANLSTIVVGPITLRLSSDGFSMFDSVVTVEEIAAEDTVELFFNCVAAPLSSSGEIFRVQAELIALDQAVLQPPEDNVALVRIQRPAELRLAYSLMGVSGGVVDHNTSFGLTVEIENQGEAEADSGLYRLVTGGVDFGTTDTLAGPIAVGRHLEFPFMSPLYDTTVTFRFTLTRIPHDRNTLAPALLEEAAFSFALRVESQDADLFVTVTPLGSNLVSPGEEKELFRLDMTNQGTSSISSILLDNLRIETRDRSGRPTSPALILVADRTVVLEDGEELSVEVLLGDRVTIRFDDLAVASGDTRSVVVRGGFVDAQPEPFTLVLETDDFEAVFRGGTHDGFPVRVVGPDGPYLLSRTYVMRGRGLEESFVVEDNPFNPLEGPALFAYELTAPSRVEFRVFTLTGEEVYALDVPESGVQGNAEIEWDGRNDEGGMVSNGVYVVSLRIVRTGEQATMKVAVVK